MKTLSISLLYGRQCTFRHSCIVFFCTAELSGKQLHKCMIKHWFEEVNIDNLRAAGEEISVFTSEKTVLYFNLGPKPLTKTSEHSTLLFSL